MRVLPGTYIRGLLPSLSYTSLSSHFRPHRLCRLSLPDNDHWSADSLALSDKEEHVTFLWSCFGFMFGLLSNFHIWWFLNSTSMYSYFSNVYSLGKPRSRHFDNNRYCVCAHNFYIPNCMWACHFEKSQLFFRNLSMINYHITFICLYQHTRYAYFELLFI